MNSPLYERARRYVSPVDGVAEGGRNIEAYRLACNCMDLRPRDGEPLLSNDDVVALLSEWNTKNMPPLPDRELVEIVASARTHKRNPDGSKPTLEPGVVTERGTQAPAACFAGKVRGCVVRFSAAQLMGEPPPQRFAVAPYLPAGAVSILAGAGGVAKTTLATQIAVARAMGIDFVDLFSTSPGSAADLPRQSPARTVILSAEDNAADYRRKLAAIRHHLGTAFDAEAVASGVVIIDIAGLALRLVQLDRGVFVPTGWAEAVAEVVREERASLVFAETVSRLAGGIESNESLSVLVEAGQLICRHADVAVCFISHVSQESARSGKRDAYAPRGGSALGDNGRSTLVLTREGSSERRVLSLPKANQTKPIPDLVFDGVSTAYGLVLRPIPASSLPAQADQRADLGRRLRELVAELAAGGVEPTATQLEMKHPRLQVTKSRVRPGVRDALDDGWLVDTGRTTSHGGGRILAPGPGNLLNSPEPSRVSAGGDVGVVERAEDDSILPPRVSRGGNDRDEDSSSRVADDGESAGAGGPMEVA